MRPAVKIKPWFRFGGVRWEGLATIWRENWKCTWGRFFATWAMKKTWLSMVYMGIILPSCMRIIIITMFNFGDVRDYTSKFCGDYNNLFIRILLNNQYNGKSEGLFRGSLGYRICWSFLHLHEIYLKKHHRCMWFDPIPEDIHDLVVYSMEFPGSLSRW